MYIVSLLSELGLGTQILTPVNKIKIKMTFFILMRLKTRMSKNLVDFKILWSPCQLLAYLLCIDRVPMGVCKPQVEKR